MISIIKNRKIWFSFSGFAVLVSLAAFMIWGLNLGIDFTGGSLLEVEFTRNTPVVQDVKDALKDMDLGTVDVQSSGDNGFILRFQDVSEETHRAVMQQLQSVFNTPQETPVAESPTEATADAEKKVSVETVASNTILGDVKVDAVAEGSTKDEAISPQDDRLIETRFDAVGPVIGQELKKSSVYAVLAVLIAIVLYIAYAFRKVSYPIQSWKYGIIAIIALFHDILIVIGVFVFLGLNGIEVNMPFVAALLTILGYSVNDTIVVFDRIRENLPRLRGSFGDVIDDSIRSTWVRSVNTSLTTLVVLLAIFFFGGVTIQYFVLALIIGVVVGTYSSIFLASPLLYVWHEFGKRK